MKGNKITIEDIREGCIILHQGDAAETRICTVNEELRNGMDVISEIDRSVTFFGSARTPEGSPQYEKARRLARRVSEELSYAIVTGGGPGIMEAANRGAHESGGMSVGFPIKLPMEQTTNAYLTKEAPFYYFFTRKVGLSFAADAYVVFPGGFGTLDEALEIITLVQTGKTARVPIILVGTAFWSPLLAFFKEHLLEERMIDPEDLSLFSLMDDEDAIIDLLRNTPKRER